MSPTRKSKHVSQRICYLLVFAIGLALMSTSQVFGQGTIAFDSGYPKDDSTAMSGTVLGQGTYTPDAGYSSGGVALFAFCTGGGYTVLSPTAVVKGTWSAAANGLPAGTYKVFARANFKKTVGMVVTYYFVDTPTVSVTVTVNTVGQTGGSCAWVAGSPSTPVAGTLQAVGSCSADVGYACTDSYFSVHKAGGGIHF